MQRTCFTVVISCQGLYYSYYSYSIVSMVIFLWLYCRATAVKSARCKLFLCISWLIVVCVSVSVLVTWVTEWKRLNQIKMSFVGRLVTAQRTMYHWGRYITPGTHDYTIHAYRQFVLLLPLLQQLVVFLSILLLFLQLEKYFRVLKNPELRVGAAVMW